MAGISDDEDGKPGSGDAWYHPFPSVNAYGVCVMPAGMLGGAWEDRQNNQDALFGAAIAKITPPSPFGVSADVMLPAMRSDPDGAREASLPSQPGGVNLATSEPFLGDDRQVIRSGQNNAWYQPFAASVGDENSAAASTGSDRQVTAPDAGKGQAGINWSMIAGNEGDSSSPYTLQGKVPDKDFQNSGVTIANGVDLGKHTAADLRRWGVSDEAIAKLTPFLKPDLKSPAPTGKNAVIALNSA